MKDGSLKRFLTDYIHQQVKLIRDGLRLLFEKDIAKNQQLEILREEVAKGFEHLAVDETSKLDLMGIFEQASRASKMKRKL